MNGTGTKNGSAGERLHALATLGIIVALVAGKVERRTRQAAEAILIGRGQYGEPITVQHHDDKWVVCSTRRGHRKVVDTANSKGEAITLAHDFVR